MLRKSPLRWAIVAALGGTWHPFDPKIHPDAHVTNDLTGFRPATSLFDVRFLERPKFDVVAGPNETETVMATAGNDAGLGLSVGWMELPPTKTFDDAIDERRAGAFLSSFALH